MIDIKKFFFPFDKFSTKILQTIDAGEGSRMFFGELVQALEKRDGKDVPAAKLHNTISHLVAEGFLTKKRWAVSKGGRVETKNQYLLTYKGRDLLRGEFAFSFLHKYSRI